MRLSARSSRVSQSRYGKGQGVTRPRSRVLLKPSQALFMARNMLRNSSFKLHVPSSLNPQCLSEELVLRYFQLVWNECDLDELSNLCSESMTMYDPHLWRDPFEGQKRVTKVIEEYLAAHKIFRAVGTPDGREVLAHWNATAAQLGDLWNRPPVGTVNEIRGMSRFEVNDRKKITRIETYRERMQYEIHSYDCEL